MKSMQRSMMVLILLLSQLCSSAQAGFFDEVTSVLGGSGSSGSLDDSTIAKGLKEALATGTTRAVSAVSQKDGYFNNELIKIQLPEKLQVATDVIGVLGYQREIDDFVLSMNRAAEKAAPKATEHIVTALKAMTFDDARAILQGDATSATSYFRKKTGEQIYGSFMPVVAAAMKDTGVAKQYKQLVEQFKVIPFAHAVGPVDLDSYVTTQAVEGLFTMLGEEERKIRTDPAARGTALLKKVFGK